MAEGVLRAAPVDLAVGVTGIAGPGGGSKDKPVGLVHFACARRGRPTIHARHVFPGNRSEVRLAAVQAALALLLAGTAQA
jgi:nicotinamide-nucleotide amidase